ncbi:HAD family phosphatase [Aquitalea sp. ASV15]|uniref:HAD family hydrolase n=1 Tax=Aquitalea sp. ASV15 TaxID=2795104 RepID=UPI0018EBA1F9|nr:HAD family phosphatase [Aquitalea sp. ASV15]
MNANMQAILFDMDGLMIDTESVSGQSWLLAAAEVGVTIPEQVILGMVGLSVHKCRDHVAAHFQDHKLAETLSQRCRHHYHQLMSTGELRLKPGIIEVLDWVQDQAIPHAVATSTQRLMCDLKLQRSGLGPYFQHTVAGDEVTNTKPAPDVYLAAAALLDIAPAACVVLEDSLIGMRAALAAGMRVILVPDMLQPAAHETAGALAVCQDLHQALLLLQTL